MITSTNPTGGVPAWTVANIAGATLINEVSCPSTTLCVAVDQVGDAYFSTDPAGGALTWTSMGINGGLALQSISCATEKMCVAGGRTNGTVIVTTDPTAGFAAWTPVHIDGTNGIFGLSCPTTTLCVAGNDLGDVWWSTTPTGGLVADWTKTAAVDTAVMQAIDCVGETFCAIANDNGDVVTTTTPTTAVAADWSITNLTGNFFFSVSCPTTKFCVAPALDTAYTATDPTAGAAAWSNDLLGNTLRATSCPSPALCITGGSAGGIFVGTQATLTLARAGTGTGTIAGPGFTCPPTCTLYYPFGSLVTAFANPGADGSTFGGWSGDCTGTGDCNLTMSTDRAATATFDPAPPASPPATAPTAAPASPTPSAPPADLPPPVQRQTANAYPESGTVLIKTTGTSSFVPLTRPQQVKFGSVFDARRGVVKLTIANGKGGFDTATFFQGQFRLVAAGNVADLRLVGGSFKGCPKAARGGASTAATKKKGRNVRHLWGQGAGAFRTTGRFASATIRGTKWLTDDYCQGTLVKVAEGAVTVRDLVTRKARALRAPKTYFARAKG